MLLPQANKEYLQQTHTIRRACADGLRQTHTTTLSCGSTSNILLAFSQQIFDSCHDSFYIIPSGTDFLAVLLLLGGLYLKVMVTSLVIIKAKCIWESYVVLA